MIAVMLGIVGLFVAYCVGGAVGFVGFFIYKARQLRDEG